MNLTDLLRMSLGNLKRRKLRTFLTVLGVIIGTSSIVVMISLGLGLQQSMYAEVEQSGGLTMLTVSGKNEGGGMMYSSSSGEQEEATKYITDEVVEEMKQMEHVTLAAPYYNMQAYGLKGKYMGYIDLVATTPEAMEAMKIPLKEGGSLPKSGGQTLDLVFGNSVISQFYEKNTGKGYWETGELPDIDLERDSLFLILDTQTYDNARYGESSGGEGGDTAASNQPKTAKNSQRLYVSYPRMKNLNFEDDLVV